MSSNLTDETEPLIQNEEGYTFIPDGTWSDFEEVPIKKESESLVTNDTSRKVKFLIYIVTFIIILGAGVVAKGTLLFMTSQLKSNKELPYCNTDLDVSRKFVVQLSNEERLAWIWCIFFVFCVQELLTLILCLYKNNQNKPKVSQFLLVFSADTAHTIGLAIFVYCVLPNLDVIKGAMLTNCVCFVPALINLLTRNNNWKKLIDFVAVCAQITGFVVWPLLENEMKFWLIPVSLFLISCGWWENYLPEQASCFCLNINFKTFKQELNQTKYYTYKFVSIWKAICFFLATVIITGMQENNFNFLTDIQSAFQSHNVTVRESQSNLQNVSVRAIVEDENTIIIVASTLTPVYVFLINISASYLMYVFGKFACKAMMQICGYALPIISTVLTSIFLLLIMCYLRGSDPCYYHNIIPAYLFFESPRMDLLNDFILEQYGWVIYLFWFFSQIWITLHIFQPRSERVQTSDKLFVTPLYNAILIDQSMALNLRVDVSTKNEKNEIKREIKRLKICATMWHESKEEIKEFLKSVLRMDIDQAPRKIAKERWNIYDSDYYELETHIFFDDAIKKTKNTKYECQVNQYVKDFINLIQKAIDDVYGSPRIINPATIIQTPYGGRLEYTLPGKSNMMVHLKDSSKVRHRKRWSQVMYMYYLLSFELNEIADDRSRPTIADNTFLLALDGDIDFQPVAVRALIDKMSNINVGAACGRIHPIGSGPMVWYQKFEYAIGHWLQKSTEHVIGCVLCSPGCFSIYRASALMQTNVIKKYTKESTEAKHFVQFDQGEDRWLCTLLLQQNFRIEYCAASDAYTHCPESFNDFYVQRKRWVPSTIANIWDLLQNSEHIIKDNKSISKRYIYYQYLLMVGTILGPGTIFLMLVGVFVSVFEIDNWQSFYYNAIPILIFIIVCWFFKSDIQLKVAALISTVYGLTMMAVLVGIIIQIKLDGLYSPTSVFSFLLASEMIITAFLHPQELICLLYGIIYFVTIPSMYLLLIIYAAFNMNDINWGTRQDKSQQEKTNSTTSNNRIQNTNDEESDGFSFAKLLKFLRCTHETTREENVPLLQVLKIVERIDKNQNQKKESRECLDKETQTNSNDELPNDKSKKLDDWYEDPDLSNGNIKFLSDKETIFWQDKIQKYLRPILKNDTEKERIKKDLKQLRDKVLFGFFMLNALFIVIVFLFTLKKDFIHINWPFHIKATVTYDATIDMVLITKTYLKLEPIGLVFLFFFAVILVIQFGAMLYHRLETFTHIMAIVELHCCCWNIKTKEKHDYYNILGSNYAKIIFEMEDTNGPNSSTSPLIPIPEDTNRPSSSTSPLIPIPEDTNRPSSSTGPLIPIPEDTNRPSSSTNPPIPISDDTFDKKIERLLNDSQEAKNINIDINILKELESRRLKNTNETNEIGHDNIHFVNDD